jgi:predicted Rossmann-fold nucleotide-binding protein
MVPADQTHVVFVKTSTVEKIRHYQAVADAKHLPILFFDVRDIAGTQHVTDEVAGTVSGNNEAKFGEYNGIIVRAAGGEYAQANDIQSNLKLQLEKHGVSYDPSRIHFATDDSAWGLLPEAVQALSKNALKNLAAHVETDVFKRALDSANGTLPGAELAPFLSAMCGHAPLLTTLMDGLKQTSKYSQKAPSQDASQLLYVSLNAPYAEPQKIDGLSELDLDVRSSVMPESLVGNHLTYQQDGKTLKATGAEYLLHHSPRAQIVEQFAKENNIAPEQNWSREVLPSERVNMKTLQKPLAKPLMKQTFGSDGRVQVYNQSTNGSITKLASLMARQLQQADQHIGAADAFIFQPVKRTEASDGLDVEAIARQYLLSSFVVARQLSLREANKPFIVLNLQDEQGKGCYDDDLSVIQYLTQTGMCKDFTLNLEPAHTVSDSGITHTQNMYFDVLSGTDSNALQNAARGMIEQYKKTYYRSPSLTPKENPAGAEQTKKVNLDRAVESARDIFKVGIFLSAGNENKELNKTTRDFSKWLAENGYGVVYGGGDRYMMGAVYDGYMAGREEGEGFIAGFTTSEIMKSETKHGKLPEGIDLSVVNKDIYERMAQMIACTDDAIVIRPGGAGTLQELAAVLLMKQVFKNTPEIRNKKIIIQNPSIMGREFYNPVLEHLFGNQYAQLKAEAGNIDGDVSKRLGVYIASDDAQVKELLDGWRDAWQQRQSRGTGYGKALAALGV